MLAAAALLLYLAATRELDLGRSLRQLGVFLGLSALLVGPLPLAVLLSDRRDPLLGAHDPRLFGADLLAPIAPGEIWRFSSLTSWHWSSSHLGVEEGSVSVGVVALACLVAAVSRRRHRKETGPWLLVAGFFAVLSLGPRLHVMGQPLESVPMPYAALTRVLPFIELAGVPVRMMVMTLLASSVVMAVVLGSVRYRRPLGALLLGGAALVLFLESWPAPLPLTEAREPIYVSHLARLPAGAVVDQLNTAEGMLYYQTLHGKPLVGGYISRVPTSVDARTTAVIALVEAEEYARLREQGVRYVLRPADLHSERLPPPIFIDGEARIYDLELLE